MKRIISILCVFVMLFMIPTLTISAMDQTTKVFTYSDSNIPERTVTYTEKDNTLIFTINQVSYTITSEYTIFYAECDEYGTLWFLARNNKLQEFIYWTNYEIEGENMIPHYFAEGELWFEENHYDFINLYLPVGTTKFSYLPTPDELNSILKNPNPPADPQPTTAPNSEETKKTTIKKVTTSKNTIKLINSNNEVVDKATFNKKKLTLSYNNKKITKVKGAWFTKRGSLVYLKTNSKAYYLKGKKSKLIKSKVASIKTTKKFATALKLKNGKIYKLK